MPILLYGLEVCSIRKTDLDSLDFVVNRFFVNLFHTDNTDIVKECQMFFSVLKCLVLLLRIGPKNQKSIRTSKMLCVRLYIISNLIKCISYVVAHFCKIVMSCGVIV